MSTVLTLVAVALGLVRLALFAALHLVPSPYNVIEHAVSDYAVGPTRRLSTLMTWVTGALWVALAAAVWTGLPHWSDRQGITISLVVLAVIFVVLPLLPTDLEGEAATTVGRLHLLAAIAWFAISYSCMGNFVRLLDPTAVGAVLTGTRWIALVSLVVLVASMVVPFLRRRAFGLSERVFIVAVNIFYVVAAIGMILV